MVLSPQTQTQYCYGPSPATSGSWAGALPHLDHVRADRSGELCLRRDRSSMQCMVRELDLGLRSHADEVSDFLRFAGFRHVSTRDRCAARQETAHGKCLHLVVANGATKDV